MVRIKNMSKYKIPVIIVFFMVLSFLIVVPLSQYGRIALTADGGFHFSRVEEIYRNLKSGTFFTFVSTRTFHHSGVGSFLFYPSVFLYPWAFLRFFFNPINSFYVWYGLMTFLTFIISFSSMLSFSKNIKRSIFFAIIYVFAGYHLYLGMWSYVLGEFIAATFLPLAFIGFYHVFWGDYKKWYWLSIGVSLIAYSHLLSLVITIFIFSILVLSKIIVTRKIHRHRIIALGKSILLASGLSAWLLVPFITDYLGSSIVQPAPGLEFIASPSDLFLRSISNLANTQYSIGFVLLFATLFGWIFVKRESGKEKTIYSIGVILLFISTSFFPWNYLEKTMFATIQFPYRLLSFGSLFMAVTASMIIVKLIFSFSKTNGIFVSLGIILFMFGGYLSSQQEKVSQIKTQSALYLKSAPKTADFTALPEVAQVDNRNYNQIFSYSVRFGETDYYPKTWASNEANPVRNKHVQSILKQRVFVDGRDVTYHLESGPNVLKYNVALKKATKINLPAIRYKRIVAYVNGHRKKIITNKRGTVTVKGVKGQNRIKIKYEPSVAYYYLFSIMVLCWLGMGTIQLIKLKG